MFHQASFDFSAPPASPPETEVQRLVAWLRDHPGFHTARNLAAALELSDRKIRQLAEHSDGMIISGPGSPGYQHLHHCSAGDLAHIADTLRSQAISMLRRALKMRSRAHAIIR